MQEDGFRLEEARIAIVGLGLMGGSLALALKGNCAALYGVDTDQATLRLARELKIFDELGDEAAGLLPKADVIVLAAPVPAILAVLEKLPELTHGESIVFDLGSSKSAIVAAMDKLPMSFDVLGGHPICGRERLSLENATGDLYRDAAFIMTPLARTTRWARSAIQQIASVIGAHLIEMTAEAHDEALAFTSHLPYLLSSALAGSLPPAHAGLTGPGFRSTARLAGTPASMMLGVLQTNRSNILRALTEFQGQVTELHAALSAGEFERLEAILDRSRGAYHSAVAA